jgi:hypothetical protein
VTYPPGPLPFGLREGGINLRGGCAPSPQATPVSKSPLFPPYEGGTKELPENDDLKKMSSSPLLKGDERRIFLPGLARYVKLEYTLGTFISKSKKTILLRISMENSKMSEKHSKAFPKGVLERIAQIIGDYKSGTEIFEMISEVGYQDFSATQSTKWRVILEFFQLVELIGEQLPIFKLIENFCDPTKWIGRREKRQEVIVQINEALSYVSLQVNDEGKVIEVEKELKPGEKQNVEVTQNSQEMIVNPIFRERKLELDNKLCFVLMPFKPSFDRLYKETIQPTVWHCGFSCHKADDFFSTKPIMEDIWIQICKSKVIIADVTGKNPNVFYEIGIAHTIGKPVIFITQDKTDVPFDVAHFRYYLYSDNAIGWQKLSNDIRSALKSYTSRK